MGRNIQDYLSYEFNVTYKNGRFILNGFDLTNQLSHEEYFNLLKKYELINEEECELEIELLVTIEGFYQKAGRDYFCNSMGNWHPGDPPECEFSITLNGYDITEHLSAHDDEYFEQYLIDYADNNY